jgi:glucan phosphoethanolaminetransferase (alkaline phosphatase superfamily)
MTSCDQTDCRLSHSFFWRYFPEWRKESTWLLFFGKVLLVLIMVILMIALGSDQRLFEGSEGGGSRITVNTVFALVIFNIATAFFLILYAPYQRKIAPLWLVIVTFLVWIFLLMFLVFFDLAKGSVKVDTIPVDLWTLVSGALLFTLETVVPAPAHVHPPATRRERRGAGG